MKSRSIFLYRELKKKSSILSEERKQYLKKLKMQKIQVLLAQALILAGFLLIWEVLANLSNINTSRYSCRTYYNMGNTCKFKYNRQFYNK